MHLLCLSAVLVMRHTQDIPALDRPSLTDCVRHQGGEHWYDGCGGLKVGTEMSGGIANVTFEDSHIVYAGAALKMLSPTGRGGFIRNVTWQRISAEESGGLLWLQISSNSTDPAENARVSDVTVRDISLDKLTCRFQ